MIQQAQQIGETIDAELAHQSVDRQIRTDFDGARAGTLNVIDHALFVAVALSAEPAPSELL